MNITIGLHTAGLQVLQLSSFNTEERVRIRDRDINSVMDGGSYMSEARSQSDSPPHATDGGQDMPAATTPGEGDITSYRGEASDWHIGYQGS